MSSNATNERLAIDGGPRALDFEPTAWPRSSEAIRDALLQAWDDGSWGRYHAPHTEQLAESLAQFHGVEFAKLCCSGTFAVELALRSLKVGAGDEVILAAYDFPGNFRAVEATGARPVLVDIEPDGWRIDLAQISAAASPQTRAILVSHLHGQLVDMPRLIELAAALQLAVVEDACQVPGAMIAGRRAGAWGHAGVLSFGGSKLLTAGRGGALLTADAEVAQRAKVFAERGNEAFPLSQLQALVLLPQLATLEADNETRRRAVARLLSCTAELSGLQSRFTQPREGVFYKVPWYCETEALGGHSREEFVAALEAEGVPVGVGFRGFAGRTSRRCRKAGDLINSRRAADSTLLLHHPILLESAERIDALAGAIAKVARAYSGKC